MDTYEIRRANLRRLMSDWGGPTTLAAKLKHANGSYLAQLAGPHPSRELSEKTARQIEHALGLPSGWLDTIHKDLQALDDKVLAMCIRAVTAALEAGKVRPPPDRFADLVSLAYEHTQAAGEVSETFITKIVRLLK